MLNKLRYYLTCSNWQLWLNYSQHCFSYNCAVK